jgi:hypothetical protein
MAADTQPIPIAYTIPNAAAASGLSRSFLYAEIKAGRLGIKKAGARTLIEDAELRRFISALPPSNSPRAA